MTSYIMAFICIILIAVIATIIIASIYDDPVVKRVLLYVSAIISTLCAISCIVLITIERDKVVKEYADQYMTKRGGSIVNGKVINYDLLSLNKGKTWYVVNDGVIEGDVKKVHPGLIEHIEGIDKLLQYIRVNGAMGSRPYTDDDIQILRNAGFEIKKK